MEARILQPFVTEWSEFRGVEICNTIDHNLAIDVMLSVRMKKDILPAAWLGEVARLRLRVIHMLLNFDVLGARIAYDDLWTVLVGFSGTAQCRGWMENDQSVGYTYIIERGHAHRLSNAIRNMAIRRHGLI